MTMTINKVEKTTNLRTESGCHFEVETLECWQVASINKPNRFLSRFFRKIHLCHFNTIIKEHQMPTSVMSVGTYRSRNNDFLVYILVKRADANKYVIDTIQFREE